MGFEDGKCSKCNCNQNAVITINAGETLLCAYHYIKLEDDNCLKSMLQEEIDEEGKISECKEIKLEIKKQKPAIYNEFRMYFEI